MEITKARSAIESYLKKYKFSYEEDSQNNLFRADYDSKMKRDFRMTIAYGEDSMMLTIRLDGISENVSDLEYRLSTINEVNCRIKAGSFNYIEQSNIIFYKEFVNYGWLSSLDEGMIDEAVLYAFSTVEEYYMEFLVKFGAEQEDEFFMKDVGDLIDDLDDLLDDSDEEGDVEPRKTTLEKVLFGN